MVSSAAVTTLPPLSRAQWLLMAACWRLGPASARDIHELLASECAATAVTTTRTQLDRLLAKGWLSVDESKRPRSYTATVDALTALHSAEARRLEAEAALTRLIGGALVAPTP